MKCLTCGERYAADPNHDYGYCSDHCEIVDYVVPTEHGVATLDDVRHAHSLWKRAQDAERTARMLFGQRVKEARSAGLTYSQIGHELGLTRQRIHQLASE